MEHNTVYLGYDNTQVLALVFYYYILLSNPFCARDRMFTRVAYAFRNMCGIRVDLQFNGKHNL